MLSLLFIIAYLVVIIDADESQFSINGNKALQILDDRFLSYTVDPAIFFADLTINREQTFDLMKRLSPAYLRVSGPSTQFLRFDVDDSKSTKAISEHDDALVFSPAMWWSLNEFIQMSNFTPIFAISDRRISTGDNNDNDKWNTNDLSALLDMTAKMNVDCLWQVGHDCSEKGFDRYKQDLSTLKRLINCIPDKKDKWQVLGSDLSKCSPSEFPEILRMYLADLKDIKAVVWDSDLGSRDDVMQKLLRYHQANQAVWLSIPKSEKSDFETAISWTGKIGQAARDGFNVVFREPRIQEFYSATPVYWTSVLHKKLMGRNVLDVKMGMSSTGDACVYTHCTKDQSSYSIRGALTVMIVNNATREHKTAFALPTTTQTKLIEVRSYILSQGENSMDTLLNGERLLSNNKELKPQLWRTKVLTHLTLTVPPKSIGYFVLPGVKIPVCIQNEQDTDQILQEIHRVQNTVDFPDWPENAQIANRFKSSKSTKLGEMYRRIENEMRRDQIFTKLKSKSNNNMIVGSKRNGLKNGPTTINKNNEKNVQFSDSFTNNKQKTINLLKSMSNTRTSNNDDKFIVNKSERQLFSNPRLEFNVRNLLNKETPQVIASPKLDLELTSGEVLRILNDRAQAKADRKFGLSGVLLEKFGKIRSKRKRSPDINVALLEKKVKEQEHEKQKTTKPTLSLLFSNFKQQTKNKDFSLSSSMFPLFTTTPKVTTTQTTIETTKNPFFTNFDKITDELNGFQNYDDKDIDWSIDDDLINNQFLIKPKNAEKDIEQIENYFANNFDQDFDYFDLFKLKKRQLDSINKGEKSKRQISFNRKFQKDNLFGGQKSFEELIRPKSTVHSNNDALRRRYRISNARSFDRDALKLPTTTKSRRIIALDMPTMKGLGLKINNRNARHVVGEINSMENAIDDFLETKKNNKLLKPSSLLLSSSSLNNDLTLVFPSKRFPIFNKHLPRTVAEIETETETNREEKEENEEKIQKEKIIADSTCRATDLTTEETTTMTENDNDNNSGRSGNSGNEVDDESQEATTYVFVDGNNNTEDDENDVETVNDNRNGGEMLRQSRSQHIQKIPKERTDDVPDSTKCEVVIKTIMNTVKRFVKKFKENFDSLLTPHTNQK